jgi:hypothetical protein
MSNAMLNRGAVAVWRRRRGATVEDALRWRRANIVVGEYVRVGTGRKRRGRGGEREKRRKKKRRKAHRGQES